MQDVIDSVSGPTCAARETESIAATRLLYFQKKE